MTSGIAWLIVASSFVGTPPAPETTAEGEVLAPAAPRLEVQALTVGAMYRLIENQQGVTTTNQLRASFGGRFALRLDPGGRFHVNGAGGTGTSFQASWNDTGLGSGDPTADVYLKQLFLTASLSRHVELQAGGISIARGETTEITSYDNDGYLTGGRLGMKGSLSGSRIELSVTGGHLGGASPNVFRRFELLEDADYAQLLGTVRWKHVALTGDLTRHAGHAIGRTALVVRPARLVQMARFEVARDVDASETNLAVAAERRISRTTLGAGYAQVGARSARMTGDRFPRGERLFVSMTLPLVSGLSVSAFASRALDGVSPTASRTRIDGVLAYNMLPLLPGRGRLAVRR